MSKTIIIGTRSSKLSLAYANKVKNLILKSKKHEKKKIEIKRIRTTGDLYKDKKMSDIGGKNFFCKEIEDQLNAGKIDIAVHSLKDMETFERRELTIGAYIKRNDPRDVLIFKSDKNFDNLKNKKIGSSSIRRELQIKLIYPGVKINDIRGNIETRISKVDNQEYDGAILAMAGLQTLKLEKRIKKIFSDDELLPAAGQGIIAAQRRKNDKNIKEILDTINHSETKICALAEKSFLKTIGGDCHTAVGALAKVERNEKIRLKVQLFSDLGNESHKIEKMGEKKDAEKLGILAGEELLNFFGERYKKKI